MKITFGKNESHDYPRISYLLQGGEWLKDRKQAPWAISNMWSMVWSAAAIVWALLESP